VRVEEHLAQRHAGHAGHAAARGEREAHARG
jgi:hypothetical protein